MRRFLFLNIIFLFALASSLVSCSDESVDVEKVNQQTVLVFMPWSGSQTSVGLYNTFLMNLDSIKGAIVKEGSMHGRVLVFLSTSASESSLYELTLDKNQVRETPVKTYSGNVYTTAEGIAGILNDVKSYAPALNYAMTIGCHGSGWTYKGDWTNYPNSAKQSLPLAFAKGQSVSRYPQTRFYGSVSDNNYATDIPTLAEAIAEAGLKMQFILFDDCYMANVETAYELKDVTNFLIASTSEVIDIGMPYQSIWSSLATATPLYDAVADAFYSFYSNYSLPCGGLSVIDCRELDELAKRMLDINSRYSFADSLRDSVQVLDGFNTPLFYDLGDYVAHLCQNTDMLNDFNSSLSKVVRKTVHTDSLYSYLYIMQGPRYIKVNSYSGLTISDPSKSKVAERGREKTAWWQATHATEPKPIRSRR